MLADKSHIEGSADEEHDVGSFEEGHDVGSFEGKSNVVGSDSSSSSTPRRQQQQQQQQQRHKRQPNHKRDKIHKMPQKHPSSMIATVPPAPAVHSPDDPTPSALAPIIPTRIKNTTTSTTSTTINRCVPEICNQDNQNSTRSLKTNDNNDDDDGDNNDDDNQQHTSSPSSATEPGLASPVRPRHAAAGPSGRPSSTPVRGTLQVPQPPSQDAARGFSCASPSETESIEKRRSPDVKFLEGTGLSFVKKRAGTHDVRDGAPTCWVIAGA